MTHPLQPWADEPGGRAQLARAVGTDWQTIHDIIRGERMPRPALAQRISDATGGAVSAAAILGVAHPATVEAPKRKRKTARPSSARKRSGAR